MLATSAVLLCAACMCKVDDFKEWRPIDGGGGSMGTPPSIDHVTTYIARSEVCPFASCFGRAFVAFELHTTNDRDAHRYGLRLRTLRGHVPFPVPTFPLLLHKNATVNGTWSEPFSPAQDSFKATLEARLVGPGGEEGAPYVFEVEDPGRFVALAWMKGWIWLPFLGVLTLSVAMGVPRALRILRRRRERSRTKPA